LPSGVAKGKCLNFGLAKIQHFSNRIARQKG